MDTPLLISVFHDKQEGKKINLKNHTAAEVEVAPIVP